MSDDATTASEPREARGSRRRAPRVTAADLVRALRRAGWVDHHQSGSHLVLRRPAGHGRVTVPIHAGTIIKPKTLASILDQAGLDVERLRDLL